MVVQICVGSSCHLKGSEDLVMMMQKAIEENGLETEVALMGSFCIGKCNPIGVTIQVDEEIHTGVTREGFKEFFAEHILGRLERERE
jgi:NADH:ubiquinone oxidoreductase subunit E